jgi:energy-converting hydrogenase Eha subunit A
MDMVDDEPLYTTREERQVWSGLVSIVGSSAIYCAYMAVELTRTPVAEISWVPPMFWSVLAGIVGTIIVAVVLEIVVAVRRPEDGKVAVDVRDREIGRRGRRLATPVMGAGLGAVLFLAALGADDFWIANVAFLSGLFAAVAEAFIKLRLYRRGF